MLPFPSAARQGGALCAHLVLFCILVGCLSGCFSVYEPPPPSLPLLAKRNDFAVSVGGVRTNAYESKTYRGTSGMLGASKAAYGDLAWAPTDHTRVAASAAYVNGRGSEGAQAKHVQTQLAGGWGTSPVSALRVEVLGGAGYDRFDVAECDNGIDGRHESCFTWLDGEGSAGRLFVQGQVGLTLPAIELGVGLRNTLLLSSFDQLQGQPSDRFTAAPILEPLLVVRPGWKWIKLEGQLALPIVLYSAKREGEPLVRSAGPRFTLGLRFSWMDVWRKPLREMFRKG